MARHKILNIQPLNAALQDTLSKEVKISHILAQVLINRGINNPQEAGKFLRADLEALLDPYLFPDMQKAVELVGKTAEAKAKVMIFGDYDVDGITALALLKNALTGRGLEVEHYLPHRIKEGYGLNKNIVQVARQKKIKLLITVDCGTNSYEEIKELKRHNIEVIVTDHHEPLNCQLPPASAIINPKLKNSAYKYRDLAGVGVAYKLAQAITREKLFDDLDLVCLGTIADVVPLNGENRVIAKEGLLRLSRTERAGLKALMEVSGIQGKKITSTFVSYILGPRLNASGRMDTAETALNLLMSREPGEAGELAKAVHAYNRQRQKTEEKIMQEAEALIDKEINFKEHKVIVIAKDGWHQGVLGIVASKLADRFYRPTILISLSDDFCKGSGRSIKNFHLFKALLECRDFLKTFGGHSHAVGLVIDRENINDFRNKINLLACHKLALEDLIPSIDIDMELGLGDISEALVRELGALEPFGAGNPEPLFYSRNLKLKGEPQLLGRDTLKFWLSDGTITHQAIGFGMGNLYSSLVSARSFDLVYTPEIDSWQEDAVILEIKDIFFS
ncbi:MAG: single-stranded-DNA-specific exonuclease RecJ [Candidatus Omnitrophota bacterium]|jgi:single-stranded-DNA-specific exonuclease